MSLDVILDRGRLRRRRLVLGVTGVAAAAAILIAMLAGYFVSDEPPVHLEIEVVDIPGVGDQPGDVAAWVAAPEEARRP